MPSCLKLYKNQFLCTSKIKNDCNCFTCNISSFLFLLGEICAFKINGDDAPFEAVVLNRTSGEGVLRASSPVDCENQKEYTFIIQAYDCGAGPSGANWKKSHK